ncbi:hypothetical protein ACFVWT_03035 [Arthrobacter sp. NPDC058288]
MQANHVTINRCRVPDVEGTDAGPDYVMVIREVRKTQHTTG